MVEVKTDTRRGQVIRMDQLKLGDQVLVAHDYVYEKVYSFGHFEPDSVPTYLRLQTTNGAALELSKDHMVFLHKNGQAVPASMVQVGDAIMMTNDEPSATIVTSVTTVTRRGAYAPFTPSGSIVVNGVKASTFVAFQESSTLLLMGGRVDTGISYQWLAHTFELPHRMWCATTNNRCNNDDGHETYDENGMSTWVAYPHQFFKWFMSHMDDGNNILVSLFFVPLIAVFFGTLGLLQVLLEEQCSWTAFDLLLLFLAVFLSTVCRIKKKKQKSAA